MERNPVLHGETAAIINLAESRPEVDRTRLTLYTTAEPCPMCAAAILWSEIPRLVIGTSVGTLRKLGRPHIAIPVSEVAERASFGDLEITPGVQKYAWGKRGAASKVAQLAVASPDNDAPYAEVRCCIHNAEWNLFLPP